MDKVDTERIKKMTNLKISYDIYEREESLRKVKMKKIMFSVAFCFLTVAGAISVDAFTDNAVSNGIKEFFKVKVNGKDYNAKCDMTENGKYKCSIDKELTGEIGVSFELEDGDFDNTEIEYKEFDKE